MSIRYLDGKRLQLTFIAGANAVNARRDHLNAINVFPVPDGDTGTNMAATLTYAADGIAHLDDPDLDEVREALARAVLVGAKGNSGFILAQFLRGFLEGIGEGVRRMHRKELVRACQEGVRRAYEAIVEPVEGTILTVMSEWSKGVKGLGRELRDLTAILDGALERARLALEHTRDQMSLLQEHEVVDAGAQGFVHMLEGISEFMHTGTVHARRPESLASGPAGLPDAAGDAGDLAYRYCTQILAERLEIGAAELRERLGGWGDSLIVSGGADLVKVHIHTNEPEEVVGLLGEVATVLEQNAEDMQIQTEAITALRRKTLTGTSERTIGLVLDSASDLPLEVAVEEGIHVVPCTVRFGEDVYRDRYGLPLDRFYELLQTHPEHPQTSQPSLADFKETYEHALETHEEVLSVHISAELSGTYQAAVQAAKEVDPERITVADSGTLSLSAGLMGLELARCIRAGNDLTGLTHRLNEMRRHSRLYCMLETLEYVVRGGRISKIRGLMGNLLGVRPILTLQQGTLETAAKVRSSEKGLELIMARLEDEIPEGASVLAVAAHVGNPEMADRVAEVFRKRFAPVRMLEAEIGPVVGAHAGPGAWGIFHLLASGS
ncbi:MAG: DegV family protein [bacterium]